MNPKELANVLIKYLGLSMCLYSIPGLFSEIILATTQLWPSDQGPSAAHDAMIHQAFTNAVLFGVREGIEVGIGILIIVKSRKIAGMLFKKEGA